MSFCHELPLLTETPLLVATYILPFGATEMSFIVFPASPLAVVMTLKLDPSYETSPFAVPISMLPSASIAMQFTVSEGSAPSNAYIVDVWQKTFMNVAIISENVRKKPFI
jgi:hypothetical protein